MKLSWMDWELERIPDPTTSGDFTRRFDQEAVVGLMEATNATRRRVWKEQPRGFLSQAFIDVDGTITRVQSGYGAFSLARQP